MASTIRPRVYIEGGVTTVKALISHPMETGIRKDKKTGKRIPAHYIEEFTVKHNDQIILNGLLGPAVSKNPFIQFMFKTGKIGDTIELSWSDNKGNSDSIQSEIKE